MNLLFIGIWILLSVSTLNLTAETNWVTRGAQTAKNVHNYMIENQGMLTGYKSIVFYDTKDDSNLPWSPSEVLKVVLSDQNYFRVFWNGRLQAKYVSYNLTTTEQRELGLKARTFLGY